MSTFVIIWIGQFISMLGTGMTNLGLPIWVYGQTGRATDLTTIGGLFIAAWAIASPFGGLMVSLVGLGGFFFPVIRGVEDALPDHGLDARTQAGGGDASEKVM
jgi:hypothetical protein